MLSRIAIALSLVFSLGTMDMGLGTTALAFETGKKANKKKARHRPVLDYRKAGRTRKIDIKMAEKRKAIRDQLQTLLKYEKDEKERPALLFRLAENYFEEAEAFFNKAMELDDQLAKDPENESLRRRIAAAKKKLRAKETEWRMKAIDQYQAIAKEYPSYPGRDRCFSILVPLSGTWKNTRML